MMNSFSHCHGEKTSAKRMVKYRHADRLRTERLFVVKHAKKRVSTKNKSEEKDIKLTVFYRKMVFFSSFAEI